MTIAVTDDVEQAALNAALALVNGGSFRLRTSVGGTLLASLPLSATAFNPAQSSGGIASATSQAISNSATPTAGTIGSGELANSSGVAKWTWTIGTSGTDMIIADNVIPANATYVSCAGLTVGLNITN